LTVICDSIKNEEAVVYMDDVIINLSKCQVLKRKVNFLGYVVESGTFKPGIEKTQAVADFPIPSDKKGVQKFLELTSYFRRFVEGYTVIAKPLSDMLRKEVRFEIRSI